MNFFEIAAQTRRWRGLMLGVLVVAMMHLSGATNASRDGGLGEPWPALLSSEPASADPSVALLQRRAIDTLEKLTQAGAEPL